uniref:Uncharacterized protein n=1 Tax=Setaria italica TaxID=4555 RepID=K3ZR42_SETIT
MDFSLQDMVSASVAAFSRPIRLHLCSDLAKDPEHLHGVDPVPADGERRVGVHGRVRVRRRLLPLERGEVELEQLPHHLLPAAHRPVAVAPRDAEHEQPRRAARQRRGVVPEPRRRAGRLDDGPVALVQVVGDERVGLAVHVEHPTADGAGARQTDVGGEPGDLDPLVGQGIVYLPGHQRLVPVPAPADGDNGEPRPAFLALLPDGFLMRRSELRGVSVLVQHVLEPEAPEGEPVRVLVHGGGASQPGLAPPDILLGAGVENAAAGGHLEHPQHRPRPRGTHGRRLAPRASERAEHQDPLVGLHLAGARAAGPAADDIEVVTDGSDGEHEPPLEPARPDAVPPARGDVERVDGRGRRGAPPEVAVGPEQEQPRRPARPPRNTLALAARPQELRGGGEVPPAPAHAARGQERGQRQPAQHHLHHVVREHRQGRRLLHHHRRVRASPRRPVRHGGGGAFLPREALQRAVLVVVFVVSVRRATARGRGGRSGVHLVAVADAAPAGRAKGQPEAAPPPRAASAAIALAQLPGVRDHHIVRGLGAEQGGQAVAARSLERPRHRRKRALGGEEVVRGGREGRRGVEVEEDAPEQDCEELGEGGDREHRVASRRGGEEDAGYCWRRWWVEWELGKVDEAPTSRRRVGDATGRGRGWEWWDGMEWIGCSERTLPAGERSGDGRSGPMGCVRASGVRAAVRAFHGAPVWAVAPGADDGPARVSG